MKFRQKLVKFQRTFKISSIFVAAKFATKIVEIWCFLKLFSWKIAKDLQNLWRKFADFFRSERCFCSRGTAREDDRASSLKKRVRYSSMLLWTSSWLPPLPLPAVAEFPAFQWGWYWYFRHIASQLVSPFSIIFCWGLVVSVFSHFLFAWFLLGFSQWFFTWRIPKVQRNANLVELKKCCKMRPFSLS